MELKMKYYTEEVQAIADAIADEDEAALDAAVEVVAAMPPWRISLFMYQWGAADDLPQPIDDIHRPLIAGMITGRLARMDRDATF